MMYAPAVLAVLVSALPSLAAPIPGQIVPNLPASVDLKQAEAIIAAAVDKYSGRDPTYGNENDYGEMINDYVPIGNTLDATVGYNNVIAIDVLADRLCIAGANQGSICNEFLAYAYGFYAAQQASYTYQQLGDALGPNNMQILSDDLRVLCLGTQSDGEGNAESELCQMIAQDVDVFANSIIGQGSLSEDDTNSNSFQLLGLNQILPAPSQILP